MAYQHYIHANDPGVEDKGIVGGTEENDYITGSAESEIIVGGGGNDFIHGDRGADRLIGNDGYDTFEFDYHTDSPSHPNSSDSYASYAAADQIMDFQTHVDAIEFRYNGQVVLGTTGVNSNTIEGAVLGDGTYEGTFNAAMAQAKLDIGHSNGQYQFAFYTDGHDGYLFADTDQNGAVDTAIELRGLTSVDDFSPSDIRSGGPKYNALAYHADDRHDGASDAALNVSDTFNAAKSAATQVHVESAGSFTTIAEAVKAANESIKVLNHGDGHGLDWKALAHALTHDTTVSPVAHAHLPLLEAHSLHFDEPETAGSSLVSTISQAVAMAGHHLRVTLQDVLHAVTEANPHMFSLSHDGAHDAQPNEISMQSLTHVSPHVADVDHSMPLHLELPAIGHFAHQLV